MIGERSSVAAGRQSAGGSERVVQARVWQGSGGQVCPGGRLARQAEQARVEAVITARQAHAAGHGQAVVVFM